MDLLFLTPNLGSGGAERQIVTIACLLKKLGHNVEFFCYANGDFYEYILRQEQIKIHWHYLPKPLNRIFYVRRFIRKRKYNAVISFLEVPNFLNNFSAIGGKKWRVITGERSAKYSTFFTRKGKIFCWFQRYSDHLVCNSNNAMNKWIELYPQYKSKICTIYNTVVIPKINTMYIPRHNNRLNIVVAASYQPLKNAKGLIKALSIMDPCYRNQFHIDWYGKKEIYSFGTKEYDESQELINYYGLQNVITLNSETKIIHEKMYKADIVALFSQYEGLPNAICEGMMLGKGIIMTRVSDYNRLVDESNGFLCDWNDSRTINNAIIQAIHLSTKDLIEKGNNSRKKALELFSEERVIKQWSDIIKNNN